jgi:hypothetical protein
MDTYHTVSANLLHYAAFGGSELVRGDAAFTVIVGAGVVSS